MHKRFTLFLLSMVFAISAWSLTDYWLVNEYFKTFADEAVKFKQFDKRVQKSAQKLPLPEKATINITMIYPGEQVSDYWRRSKTSFVKRLDELGIHYKLTDFFTKPGTEIRKQSRLILKAIKQDTDYLIFTLDANKHKKLIEQIIRRKKPKIILQNITTPLKEWGNRQPFLYVGFDHVLGTELLINYYKKHFPSGGKYAVLYGTKGYVSEMRGDTFIQAMNKTGKFTLLDSFYTDFNRQKAYDAAKDILKRHPGIDFIYSCSTDVGIGAIDAIKEAGRLDNIITNGWGGGSKELDSLLANELSATVMRMNDDNGIAMAEAIQLDLAGETDQIPTVYSGSFSLLDENTDSSDIKRLEKKAFRYSK